MSFFLVYVFGYRKVKSVISETMEVRIWKPLLIFFYQGEMGTIENYALKVDNGEVF